MNALAVQAQRGGTVGEHLVLAGVIDDDSLADFYRTRLMVPQVTLRQLARIGKDIIQRIPADMATEHRCVPVSYDRDGNLTVAMAEPSNTQTVDELGFFTGCYVVRAVATQSQIAWALAHYYGRLTQLGEHLLHDPGGALIPGPMPPRRALQSIYDDISSAPSQPDPQPDPPAPATSRPNSAIPEPIASPEEERLGDSGNIPSHPPAHGEVRAGSNADEPAPDGHALEARVAAERHHAMAPVLSPFHHLDGDAERSDRSANGPDGNGRRSVTNSENTGGNISGEFVVSDVVEGDSAAPREPVVEMTARLPSSRPIPMAESRGAEPRGAEPTSAELSSTDHSHVASTPAPNPDGGSVTGSIDPPDAAPDAAPPDRRSIREKLPLPAEGPKPEGTTSSPIPVIIEDDDSPPTYRPRPTGRLGRPQRVISFFQEDTPPTREIQAPPPRPENDPELIPRFGEVSVRSQPIQILESSLPAVVIQIEDQAEDQTEDQTDDQTDDQTGVDAALEDPATSDPPEPVEPHDTPHDTPHDRPQTSEPSPQPPPNPAVTPSARPLSEPASAPVSSTPPGPSVPLPAQVVESRADIGTAPTIPPPVARNRPRRKRTRTFQGLGIGNAQPVIPRDDPPDTEEPTTDPDALPKGLNTSVPPATPATAPAADDSFDEFPSDFDSGNWNEIFSDGAPVRAPDMPTLRVSIPSAVKEDALNTWSQADAPAISVADSIQKAAEAAAEAHARAQRETESDIDDTAPNPVVTATKQPASESEEQTTGDADQIRTEPRAGEYGYHDGHDDAGHDAGHDDDDDDDDDDHDDGGVYDPTFEMDAAELPAGLELPGEPSPPVATQRPPALKKPGTITGESTGRLERKPATVIDHGVGDDDQWGPPGTTIPPPFLGAVSYDESGNLTGIPLITDDIDVDVSDVVDVPPASLPKPVSKQPAGTVDGVVAPIHSPGSGRHDRSEPGVQAPLSLYDSEHVTPQVLREFENSQESLAELLRRLQLAETRDAVIQIMLEHMAESHESVAFFVVKGGRLEPFQLIGGTGLTANDPTRMSKIRLRLDFASTFQDIVATRLPYRGPITDQASRDFVYKTFGAVGETMLGLPVTIRERVVGVLYGDNNKRHVFVQNLGVLVRAAGGALERIIKYKKS